MAELETRSEKNREERPSYLTARLDQRQFKQLKLFIEGELGIKMPETKKIMLESRLQKRLRAMEMLDFSEYLEHVFSDKGKGTELIHMIDAVTTNKTDFFREPDHFDYLLDRILPDNFQRYAWGRGGHPVKVWSAASSSGEEPYTIAMVLEEFRERQGDFDYRILGTDISMRMLERGLAAIYPEERIAPVPEMFRKKYLFRSKDREAKLVRIKPVLRKKVSFSRLNLMSPSFNLKEKFHIVFCRNVIIYFDRDNQAKLLRKIYDYMLPGGYLLLGHSETLTGVNLPLYSVAPTIYRKPD